LDTLALPYSMLPFLGVVQIAGAGIGRDAAIGCDADGADPTLFADRCEFTVAIDQNATVGVP
jgi:hypothetical protein